MSINPYDSPNDESSSNITVSSRIEGATDLFGARLPIYIVLAFSCIGAILSLMMFAFQALIRDPLTGGLFRDTEFAWFHLGGHLVRGIGLTGCSFFLFRYVRAIGKPRDLSTVDLAVIFNRSRHGWWVFVAFLFMLMGYAAAHMAYVSYIMSRPSLLEGLGEG